MNASWERERGALDSAKRNFSPRGCVEIVRVKISPLKYTEYERANVDEFSV